MLQKKTLNDNCMKVGFTSEPNLSEEKSETYATLIQNKTVNIEPLKSFVFQRFPKESPLRAIILAERTILTAPEFLAKLETWQALLRIGWHAE